ncbi:UPF0280 family protein [Taklimakanibacter lacteus]|uniref:UPF0280 family protein n=1 Tax=Taklimakanibacter lacteus TaxID=2268456 RepID=UPI000E662AC7
MTRYQAQLLADGKRLHLHDGPIDLLIEAKGDASAVRAAYGAAELRFATILDELCAELSLLRQATSVRPEGITAQLMWRATLPFARGRFITPMAAVAGSVAEEILAAMTEAAHLARAYVNNGGDIALHLAPGSSFRIGLVDRPDQPSLFGTAEIGEEDGVRGIATSGWRGRSFSLGIADAVTVLAETASHADAAATIIANDVDLPGHAAIARARACDIQPDNDLKEREVTRGVGALSKDEIDRALTRGCRTAQRLVAEGLVIAAALHLQGETRTVGHYRARNRETARIAIYA